MQHCCRRLKKHLSKSILELRSGNYLTPGWGSRPGPKPCDLAWKTLPRLCLYATTLCMLSLTFWTMSVRENHVITVDVPASGGMFKAVYKYAVENADGSIDLVLNIPSTGPDVLKESHQDPNASHIGKYSQLYPHATTRKLQQPQHKKFKSTYPGTLDWDYAINSPNICQVGQPVDYLVIVHSATAYFARRRTIRETYGGQKLFANIVQRVVFLLGMSRDPMTSRSIREEAFLYRDIVQGRFMESYHNLTHKGVLGFRWISEYCPQAQIIIKIDDDVFIDPFRLVQDMLPRFTNKSHHIACHLRRRGTSPILRGKGKWPVHEDQFKGLKNYPFDYCNGYFVIIASDLIRPMLNAARFNPFFWIEDVYLFGLLPATVGAVTFVDIRESLALRFNDAKKCYQEKGPKCKLVAVSQWKPEEPQALWYAVLSNLSASVRKQLRVFGL